MTFAEPAFLLLLLLVPLLALGAWLAERQRRLAWHLLVAPRLRSKLAAPVSSVGRWLSLGCGLLGLSLLIITLAQPIAEGTESKSLMKGRNIIIAVDASRSMLVRDVAPDRLTAAKTAVYELLERFPEDRIGLLAFAGSASLQAPLTVDHNALRETLVQLDESNVPSGGSNLAEAIHLATRTFKETGQRTHGLIVLSDGELHEGELEEAALDARKAGIFIVTVGLGSREGDFVPDAEQEDGRFRDNRGRPVLSRLNSTPLRSLAGDTGGLYLEGAGADFTEKIDTVISRLDAFESEGRVLSTPLPRYRRFLLPAMILLLSSLLLRFLWAPARPPAAAARPLALLLISAALLGSAPRAQAWTNPLEGYLGSRALKRGDTEKALQHFERAGIESSALPPEKLARIRFGEGAAHYKRQDFQKAGDAFAEALLSSDQKLQRDAHSQLANTLYHRALREAQQEKADLGKSIAMLEDALQHYDSALKLDKKHEPSTDNRKVVAEALKQLKQQQQQQEQQQEQEPQDGDGGEDEQEQEPQDGDPEEQDQGEEDQGENGEQEEGEEGEQQEGEEGEEGEQDDQGQGEEPGEEQEPGQEGEESDQQGGQEGQQQQQAPAPRADESAEEFARRILEENADMQKEALGQHRRQAAPNKDW